MACRDSLLLELGRMADAGKSGVRADEGKTLKDCFESFLASNFTAVQRKTIADSFGSAGSRTGMRDTYSVITELGYRKDLHRKILVSEFVSSGFLRSSKGLEGLAGVSRLYAKGFE